MTFAIYDAPTDGNLIWPSAPETHIAVPVINGLFSIGLGSLAAGGIPTSVWNGDRYQEINVSGETLSPRKLIRSVPIAGMALTVPDGTITGHSLASSGFGQSGSRLFNYVPVNLRVTVAELSNVSSTDWTPLDLSSYLPDDAIAVVLLVGAVDSNAAKLILRYVWTNPVFGRAN